MNLVRINEVVEYFGLSSRTLRYYEERGLIWSHHPDNKAQRYYDDAAIDRLKQIIVLRKLQIPIKDMVRIFNSESTADLIKAFMDKLESLEIEITALSELRRIVDDFLHIMLINGIKKISAITLLYEETEKRLGTIKTLETGKADESVSFGKLSEVSREAFRLNDVRIIRLPALPMLTSRLKTGQIEDLDGDKMQNLFAEYGVIPIPGLRNCFYRKEENDQWLMMINMPRDFVNQSPYEEEEFPGGLYAVTSSYFEDMDDTLIMLKDWVRKSEDYELDLDEKGLLRRIEMIEEILPWDIAVRLNRYQQDIFVPIRIIKSVHNRGE